MINKDHSMMYNEYNEPIAPLAPDAWNPEIDKAEYEGTMEKCLKEFGAKLDELMAKTDSAKRKALADLKAKHSAANQKLQELKTSSNQAWAELQAGLDKAFEEMGKACDEVGKACDEIKLASEKASQKFKH